ncbi:hypothetical protein CYY_005518 [Polysphondylium violaceum]|uniref:ADF-H domain-containing protein n=1 Tax=Polysphondylium violaceum TaxID=133409 RepID=A0A8J4PSV8_9MYCE|nr:hypothetical protein CYY_005518 [Polysphondylium violaceum]
MSSGVKLAGNCVATYEELKLKKTLRAIIYKIGDKSQEIEVEETLPASSSFADVIAKLSDSECRYVIVDFAYDHEGPKNKICFVAWCPDTANIKKKMLYTSSKDSLRKALNGVAVEIQGTDKSEVSNDSFLEKCKK